MKLVNGNCGAAAIIDQIAGCFGVSGVFQLIAVYLKIFPDVHRLPVQLPVGVTGSVVQCGKPLLLQLDAGKGEAAFFCF